MIRILLAKNRTHTPAPARRPILSTTADILATYGLDPITDREELAAIDRGAAAVYCSAHYRLPAKLATITPEGHPIEVYAYAEGDRWMVTEAYMTHALAEYDASDPTRVYTA